MNPALTEARKQIEKYTSARADKVRILICRGGGGDYFVGQSLDFGFVGSGPTAVRALEQLLFLLADLFKQIKTPPRESAPQSIIDAWAHEFAVDMQPKNVPPEDRAELMEMLWPVLAVKYFDRVLTGSSHDLAELASSVPERIACEALGAR